MGRPLYSKVFKTTPAVRELEQPTHQKWSHLNAFDPDSDEFFENENAVYEDFIGPVRPGNPDEEEEEEEVEEVEERDMLFLRLGNVSPVSLLSDRTEDSADLVVDEFRDIDQLEDADTTPDRAVRVRLARRVPPVDGRWVAEHSRVMQLDHQSTSPVRSHIQRESLPMPPRSASIPIPIAARHWHASASAVDERPLALSSTPPRQSSVAHVSMSPPPTSTPRLYTWARNPVHASSPSTGSPFTNPHARTSYTHLSPALIRIRDVTV